MTNNNANLQQTSDPQGNLRDDLWWPCIQVILYIMHTSAKFQLLQEAPKHHFIIVGIQSFNRTFQALLFSKMGFNNNFHNPCNSQCTTRSSSSYPYLHIISNWVRGKLPPGREFEWINFSDSSHYKYKHFISSYRYDYMNPNYGYGSNYPSANPNYGNYAPLNQQGIWILSFCD